jgi:hypothetical protein
MLQAEKSPVRVSSRTMALGLTHLTEMSTRNLVNSRKFLTQYIFILLDEGPCKYFKVYSSPLFVTLASVECETT